MGMHERHVLQRKLPSSVSWTAAFLFYFFAIAAILSPHAYDGFIGDAAAYVAVNTYEYSIHPWFPFLSEQDTGHPLIYGWLNGLLWRWFGFQPVIANVSIWCYAALALVAIQYLTQKVVRATPGLRAPRWAGVAAASCLLSTPLFISHTARYLSAMPHLAFALMMLVAWYRNKRGWLTLWTFLLTFTRITGFLSVFGLGLFDLGRELFRNGLRRPKTLVVLMIPYVTCGSFLIAYLTTKVFLLERPMTTIEQNRIFVDGDTSFIRQLGWITEHTFQQPRYGFSLLAIPIIIALIVYGYQRQRKKSPAGSNKGEPRESPSNQVFYGAFLLVMLVPALLYAVHHLWPQPRWFLIHHALIVIAGVHSLLYLMRNRRKLIGLAILLWCGLQIFRWQPDWVLRTFSSHPSMQQQLVMYPSLTLNIAKQKRLYHELALWCQDRDPDSSAFIAAWPTYKVFDSRQSGYIQEPYNVSSIEWLAQGEHRLEHFIRMAHAERDDLYLLLASWDQHEAQGKIADVLDHYPAFQLEAVFDDGSHNEVRVYRFRKTVDSQGAEQEVQYSHCADRLYRILLGRTIDLSALKSWDWTMSTARDRRAATREALKGLVSSSEFRHVHPTHELRVNVIHEALLGRSPTKDELHKWRVRLETGEQSLADLVEELTHADEFCEMFGRYFAGEGEHDP